MTKIIAIIVFVGSSGFYLNLMNERDEKLMTINYQLCEDIEGNFTPCIR